MHNSDGSFCGIHERFLAVAKENGERLALEVGKQSLTYSQLQQYSSQLARAVEAVDPNKTNPLAAFLAYRSVTAYASVLGILGSGKGYVPLHPNFPVERTQRMLESSGVDVLIVGSEGAEVAKELLARAKKPLTVICPDWDEVDSLSRSMERHRFLRPQSVTGVPTEPFVRGAARTEPESIAYVLFTSGSTGVPKGVPVRQRNVLDYIDYVRDRYQITPADRLSQMFDMTFDLSVHDMFCAWLSGACLCSVPLATTMAPGRFIKSKQLSLWFSVPSVIGFMERMRMLKPDSYPELRVSLFCGEPLLGRMAQLWQDAAPNSRLENLYGPTEATIAISHYQWDSSASPDRCVNGVTPIGDIFSTQAGCIVSPELEEVAKGETGELCLGGSQVTSGYLNNPEKTRQQFVELPGREGVWYRTGDLVREEEDGCLCYLGRNDSQVQVRGHRVELQEVDNALRKAVGSDLAVCVSWPVRQTQVEAVYGFACPPDDGELDVQQTLDQCKQNLPEYAVPRDIFCIDEMPLNANGKIDRSALADSLEELLNEQSS